MKVIIVIDSSIETKDKKPAVFLINTKIGKRVSYLVTNFLPLEARTIIDNSIEILIEEKIDQGTVEVPMEMLCQRCANWIRHKMDREKHPKDFRLVPMKKDFEFLKS